MNIVVFGSSNSAVSRAYADALSLHHDVSNFSAPGVPVSFHIANFLRHQEALAQADVLIIEHALDDMIVAGNEYQSRLVHIENFYGMLASLGKPVLNLISPALDQLAINAEFASTLKALSSRYGFWLLDLNSEAFTERFFASPTSLKRHVSHTFGILLGDLLEVQMAERSDGVFPRRRGASGQLIARSPIFEQVSGLALVRKLSRKPTKAPAMLSCPYQLLDAAAVFADKNVAGAAFARAERSYISLMPREKFFIGTAGLAEQQLLAIGYTNQTSAAATLTIEIDQQKIDVSLAEKAAGNYLLGQSCRFGDGMYLSASFADAVNKDEPQELALHDLLFYSGGELQVTAAQRPAAGQTLEIAALVATLSNSMPDEVALAVAPLGASESTGTAAMCPADEAEGLTDAPADAADLLAASLADVPAEFVNAVRDAAVDYEKRNVSTSYALMNIAKLFRPKGPVILRKIAEYEEAIKKAKAGKA